MTGPGAQEAHGRRPAYVKAAEDLRDRILSGEFASGSALPSELALAVQYGISRTSVRNSIRRLREWELVETRRGSGTYVLWRAKRPISVVGSEGTLSGSLDPEDSRAPSKQIADQLRSAILAGRLQPNTKLPSQNQLSALYGVARETVKTALRHLAAEGLIVSRQGSGSYVHAGTSDAKGSGAASSEHSDAEAFNTAMKSFEEVHGKVAHVIQTTPEPSRAFDYSSQLANKLRDLAEGAADLRAQAAVRIAEHEKLSLTVLAMKISTSRARAGQLMQRGKRIRQESEIPRKD
ncbi:GntR family transcriptional regulator [Actinomadura sp. 7K507]|uniref:GntR family transcriptional regulator n=1 Tax=Actinomadura sp. 7K507 TaxID=2530365 RepID=UPI0010534C1A|nr:GntR family transcriptional regulator [Actinomadura sp. 7K507]TDC96026.1 GntR family transcriptional regulator [Actinomadura sp. 7K507]